MRTFYNLINGFVLVLLISLSSMYIASCEFMVRYHISPLIIGVLWVSLPHLCIIILKALVTQV